MSGRSRLEVIRGEGRAPLPRGSALRDSGFCDQPAERRRLGRARGRSLVARTRSRADSTRRRRTGSQDRGRHVLLRVHSARGCRRNRILGEFGSQVEGREGGARSPRRPGGSLGRVPRASGSLCVARVALARERRHRPRDRPRRNLLWDQLAEATSALGLRPGLSRRNAARPRATCGRSGCCDTATYGCCDHA